ncbi:MAG: sugar phosphate isomerase/epimerase [Clostridia bacterium]|nr:sugar phosphate isomerase/epimerase [Clostridia bacterium]
MFQKLGFQLYSIRDLFTDREFADLCLQKLAAYGYSEIHSAGEYLPPEVMAELAKKNGFTIIGNHYANKKILADPKGTMEYHRILGTTNVGFGSMPKDARVDLEGLKNFVQKTNEAAKIYASEGFKMTYHNHRFEFCRIDGYKTMMDILVEGLDPDYVSFVLDTCWVSAAGGDPVDWIKKLAGRIDILHLKDMTLSPKDETYRLTEVGFGNLSWAPIIQAAEETGVKHYVVEQDSNWDQNPVFALGKSAQYLEQFKK